MREKIYGKVGVSDGLMVLPVIIVQDEYILSVIMKAPDESKVSHANKPVSVYTAVPVVSFLTQFGATSKLFS